MEQPAKSLCWPMALAPFTSGISSRLCCFNKAVVLSLSGASPEIWIKHLLSDEVSFARTAQRAEVQVQSLGQEVPLEKEMAPHSSILAWTLLCLQGVPTFPAHLRMRPVSRGSMGFSRQEYWRGVPLPSL